MPSVVGKIRKGASFDSLVDVEDVGSFNSATEKTTPVDADLAVIADSANSYARKRLTWSNIKATLKTYFDTIYQAVGNFFDKDNDTLDDITDGATYVKSTNDYTDTEKTKLAGIETGADVTDTDNVTAAGALMDSEVDADIKTLALPANTTISTFGASLIDDADAATARSTLGLVIGTDVLAQKTIGIADNNLVEIDDADASDNDYTKFTANGLEGRSYSEVRTDINLIGERTLTVESPSSSEDISIFFTNRAITITEIRAVLVGSSTPSVTWTVRHGTDRSATGNEAVTGGTTTTSTTTGSDVTTFDDATIAADSFVWLETTAQSGTVDELSITIIYTID